MKRRHFLMASGLFGAGFYINQRGLRYPRLGFEPDNPATKLTRQQTQLDLTDFIVIKEDYTDVISLRAIAPEPSLTLSPQNDKSGRTVIAVSNISPLAILEPQVDSSITVHETVNGINRTIELTHKPKQNIHLNWSLPNKEQTTFAVIGDSGGGVELDWCITRAEQLNVNFLLHLGDFHYGDGEYERAIIQFNNAPIPIYVSIGNHDFNDSGLVYQQFLEQIGPMNNSFVIAGTRFVNVDTAVNFFPAYSGNRGELMRQLINQQQSDQEKVIHDHVIFTHKPFVDSRGGDYSHDISGVGEIPWLQQTMQKLGANNLLCGHVHHSSELEYKGIQQWTVGEGLGHEDLVHKKLVSKILVGTTNTQDKVSYQWHDLEMPWQMHQSHTHEEKLRDYNRLEQLEWYQNLL